MNSMQKVINFNKIDELNSVLRELGKKESEYNRKYLTKIASDYKNKRVILSIEDSEEFYNFMKTHYNWQFML